MEVNRTAEGGFSPQHAESDKKSGELEGKKVTSLNTPFYKSKSLPLTLVIAGCAIYLYAFIDYRTLNHLSISHAEGLARIGFCLVMIGSYTIYQK